jgi:hypothetical protein
VTNNLEQFDALTSLCEAALLYDEACKAAALTPARHGSAEGQRLFAATQNLFDAAQNPFLAQSVVDFRRVQEGMCGECRCQFTHNQPCYCQCDE